jgi:hypothetical protein
MKWIVLRRLPDGGYAHVGTPETVDEGNDMALRQRAVELAAETGGAHVVIPFDEWVMFEAHARIVVRPVPRAGEMPSQDEPDESVGGAEGDDMEGLARPGERLP